MTGPTRWLLFAILLAAVSACGGGDADDAARREGGASGGAPDLPAPEGAVGSVTGMPDHPGPVTVPLGGAGTTAPASTATGTGTETGIATGTARGDAGAAIDDGGLDRMAVDTDFPEPIRDEQVTPATAPEPVPPIIIVEEPNETVPSTTGTTHPTDHGQDHDDH